MISCGERKMVTDKALIIDPADVKSKFIQFFHSTLKKRGIEGLLIQYRDCLEVIINVHLAKETVGRENVKVLVTKGRFIAKQPREEMDLATVNKYLDLPPKNIIFANKEPILQVTREVFSEHDFRFFAPSLSLIILAHILLPARILAISSKKSL